MYYDEGTVKQANGIQMAALFILENPSIFEVTVSTLSFAFIMNWKRQGNFTDGNGNWKCV